MKNFTNNFKQFTSRLSARWLIMALMMLVGTSSAWALSLAKGTYYFDNSITKFANCYLYVGTEGDNGKVYCYQMSRVAGTKQIYSLTTSSAITHNGIYVCSEKWWDSSTENVYKFTYHTTKTFTDLYKVSFGTKNILNWSNGYVYIPSSDLVKPGHYSQSSKEAYKWDTSTTFSKTLTLTNKVGDNNTDDAGTIAVTKWNSTSSSAGSAYDAWKSTSAATASYTAGYKTALKVTATPKPGYELVSLTVNGTSVSSGHEFEVTAETTIVATWEAACTPPAKPTFDPIPAKCGSYTLPTEDKNRVSVNWYTAATGGEKITSVTTTSTYYAEAVDGTCTSAERTPVQITINKTPTITASKTSCAPYEEITLSSAAGPGTTWSADGGMLSATSGESVTFKAAPADTPYTVAASANGCTDTETITVECAAEECSSKSVEFEIWLKVTGTIPTCHVWMDGTSDLGITSWPGNAYSTTETEGGQTYYIWKFKRPVGNSYKDIGVIFSYDKGANGKTGDIIVKDALGKRHVFAYNSSDASKTTKPEKSEALYSPIVTTVSAEQKEGEAAVVIKGFLQATGCADITKYGYQYRVSGNGDYTDVQEDGSKNICDEWVVECGDLEYGVTYDFRAKATNKGGGKGYGDVIQVTIQGQSTPVVIKAVRNDKTVNESHWADFVALYVQEDGITAAGAKEVKNYTWEYSTDGTNWSTNFTGYVLGGASATVGVTNGNAKCNNIRPTKTGKYRVKVTYDNTKEQYSNIITITSDGFKLKYPEYGQNAGSDFAFEAANRTIPVFVVKTTENFPDCPASGMPSQDVEGQKAKKSVDVKIFENGNVVYDRKARMNYRGSSSLNFRKKSYAFCTGKEKTKNSKGDVDTGKENLFGLSNGAKDKDWVLYAAMPDPSMMRNRLIFDTYAQMTGKWGVDSKFVELIIDDEYMGVYVLMDKITNNEKRVNITAADGFILKFDKTDVTDRFEDENSEKRNTFTTEKTGKSGIGSYGATFDQRFEIEYPEMEDMGTEKWVEFVNDNVKGKIEAFEKALEAGNYTEVRKLIDYESWADWFIISEFAKNVDAYRASCFFVYNGDKIEARPLWDQELSFNNTATTVGNGKGCNSPDGLLIQNSGVYSDDFPAPFWFIGHTDENKSSTIIGGLLNDPCFVTMVKNRYKDHLNNALSNGQLTGKISDYQEELTDAAQNRETATWRPSDGEITACTGGGTGYTNVSESTSISTMTKWITDRPAKLTTALDALTGSSVNISIEPSFVETYPWEPFTLTVDAPEGYEYEMAFTKEGADATGNMVVLKGGDIYTVKIKRPANTLEQVFETVPYLATATLKVADDGCGGMTTPEANVNIRLNDREEDCE